MADRLIAPVQTLPAGLLGFLGIKNGGENPSPLSQGLSATLETFQFYTEQRFELIGGGESLPIPVGGAQQTSVVYTCPPKTLWLIRALAIFGASGATAMTFPYVGIQKADGNLYQRFQVYTTPPTGVGAAVQTPTWWMFPGDRLCVGHNGPAGATGVSCNLLGWVCPFQL